MLIFRKITRYPIFISKINIDFIYLQDAENLYYNYPEILALRTILIYHLEYNTDVTIHTEFSNCLTPEWEIFLKECYPYFLIVSDKGITKHQTDFLNILIMHALQKKINIVQISGIESDVLRIHGYYASSLYMHKQFFEKVSYVKLPRINEQHQCGKINQRTNSRKCLFKNSGHKNTLKEYSNMGKEQNLS